MTQAHKSLKFGWLLNHFRAVRHMPMAVLFMGLAAVLALGSPAGAQVISAHREWAAIQFGERCEARSRAVRVERGRPPPYAGFAFDSRGRLHGQFYARLSRSARPGSTAILTIGSRPFLLAVRGEWAWGRGARQDAAIMEVARYAGSMRIESRDPAGRRFVDRYLLGGAATAIDAAAAACAQAGKSR